MSVFQRHSTSNLEVESPQLHIGGSASLDLGAQAPEARLSGPKANLDGGDVSKELVIEPPLIVAKPEVSYNVESTPDSFMDMDSFGIGGKSDHDFDLPGGSGAADIDTNANMAGKSEISGGDMEIDFTAPAGIFGDADVSVPGASGKTEVKLPDAPSISSDTKDVDIDVNSKDSKFSLKKFFPGGKSKEVRISSPDEPSAKKKPGAFQKFFGHKSSSGNVDTGGSLDVELTGAKAGAEYKGEFVGKNELQNDLSLPNAEVKSGGLPSGGATLDIGLPSVGFQRGSKDDSSGSETSDGEGGRIKRKFKTPKFGMGFGGGVTGGARGDDSGSDTSDGKGGRIKRKFKTPNVGFGLSGGAQGSKGDDSGSETSDGEGGRIKRKLKVPKFGVGIGGGVSGKDRDGDSGSDTSDGQGGRIKRKLKLPAVGIGFGGGASRKFQDDDSGSETSDGKGGRIKRKLKGPRFGISGGVERSKPGYESDSETSDGEGGRIKRKLKLSKPGFGVSAKMNGSKSDSDSETSDGEGGRIKRKLKVPNFGIGGGVKIDGSKDSGDRKSVV